MGSQPGPASSQEPGAGRASAPGLPPPPGQSKPEPPPQTQTKGPTAGSKREGEEPLHPQPNPGGEGDGVLFTRRLGALRRSASVGPASGQTDRRTMGPGPQLGLAGPGLSGTEPRQAEGGFEPSRWRGAEGRRCRRTKPTADRQTEGEKMATRAAGARWSRTRSQ